ncbi:MAG: hypothetical protein WCK31_03495, partial [bacterium]
MKTKTTFLKYLYRNIGVITYLVFITLCFCCFYLVTSDHPSNLITAISDFGIHDETKWIFLGMCTVSAFGLMLLFKEVLTELKLGKNLFINAFGVALCAAFIGVALFPYNYFRTPHTLLTLSMFLGFGIFLLLIAIIKKFQGKYMRFTGILGVIDILFMFIFPLIIKPLGGWLFPEIILLSILGFWIVVSELFLKERMR